MLSVWLRGKRSLNRSFLGKIGVRFVFVSFRIWLSLYESGGYESGISGKSCDTLFNIFSSRSKVPHWYGSCRSNTVTLYTLKENGLHSAFRLGLDFYLPDGCPKVFGNRPEYIWISEKTITL